jgi:hypothetical protein
MARVLEGGEPGTVLLRIGRSTVTARSEVELPPGTTVRLAVIEAQTDRIVLSLGAARGDSSGRGRGGATVATATGEAAAAIAVLLRDAVGDARAPAFARLLAGRGAEPGPAAELAARFLAGDESPVGTLRRLAARDAALRDRLAAAGRDAVSGDAAAVAGAAAAVRDAAAVPPDLAAAQRLLAARPGDGGASLLFLPLPGGGEARISVEAGSRGERLDSFRLGVELALPRLGALSVELLGHQGAAFVTIRSEQPAAVAELAAATPRLEDGVAEALGRPTRAAVVERPPARAPVVAEADLYA